jgi:thioredoxin-related protein
MSENKERKPVMSAYKELSGILNALKSEEITLNDAKTMQELKKEYILLALNRDAGSIPAKYKVKRVPKHFFLTAKGEVIYSILGYWNPEDFASFTGEAKKKKNKIGI